MELSLSLLGGADLGDRGSGGRLPPDRRGWLLAYLAVDGGWVERDRLAVLFWPTAREGAAKRNLRQLVLRARRLDLGPALDASATALRWSVDSDVVRFRAALAAGDDEAAVALYRGPLLHGFPLDDGGGVDAWLEAEREALHGGFHRAALRLAARWVQDGRPGEAASVLRRVLDLDPLAEDVVEARMRALAAAGRRDAALALYRRFEGLLADELGLEPLAPTQELAAAVAAGRVAPPPLATAPDRAPTDLVPPRLVGRAAEVAAAEAARTPLVVVQGESGVGKTRLLAELVPDACRCVGVEGLQRVPYHPFAALLRSRPELADGLGRYREDLARLVPEVAPDLEPGPSDPATVGVRLAEALARAIGRAGERSGADASPAAGAALVFDDLQWADEASLDVVAYLVERRQRVHAALRPHEAPERLRQVVSGFESRGLATVIPLGGLSPGATERLLADLMGRDEGPPLFARWLHDRSAGNPMFALETLRSLFDAGTLRAGADGWSTPVDELTRDYRELDVPPAIADVIRRRAGRFAPATRRTLEAAALMGTSFERRVLPGVVGLSPNAVADALVEAEEAGFVHGGAFRHDVFREVLHRDVPEERRLALHAALAAALARGRGRSAAHAGSAAGVVAEHWWRAGEVARAREAWTELAAGLRERGLQEQARSVIVHALELIPRGYDAAALRVALAEVERELDRPEAAEACLDAAAPDVGSDTTLRLSVVLARANLALHRGSIAAASALLEDARPLAALVDDERLVLDDAMLRARVAHEAGDMVRAERILEPVYRRLRRRRPDLATVRFATSLAAVRGLTEGPESALPLHREAHGLAKALGAHYHQVDATINLMHCLADLGGIDEAIRAGEEALALGPYDNAPILRTNLTAVLLEAGRDEEALVHLERLVEEEQPYVRIIALARRAHAHARLGRLDLVPGDLDRALAAARSTDYATALGRVAVEVIEHGSDAQVASLRALLPERLALQPYLQAELDRALEDRASRAAAPPGEVTPA